jgi:hypothetical protein
MLLFAFITPAFLDAPKPLPSVALGTELLWYLETSVILLGISALALTFIVRGVWHGTVPLSISREGLEWQEEATQEGDKAIAALQEQIDTLEADIEVIARAIAEE